MNNDIPKNITEAKNRLESKMVDTLLFFERKLNRPIPLPTLYFKPLGLCWGRATKYLNLASIEINSDLMTPNLIEKNWSHLHDVTMPHEVCHIIAPMIHNPLRHGRYRGHGDSWKECMLAIGLQPDRCCEMDNETRETATLRNVPRKYAYKCNCQTHYLTSIKHNRVQLGKYRRLHCIRCKGSLVYLGEKVG